MYTNVEQEVAETGSRFRGLSGRKNGGQEISGGDKGQAGLEKKESSWMI